jgi:hypothetical protein
MEWLYPSFAIVLICAGVAYLRKRSRVNHGDTCWQCGFDLSGCASRIDFRGDRRCPKCGELIEADVPGRVDEL